MLTPVISVRVIYDDFELPWPTPAVTGVLWCSHKCFSNTERTAQKTKELEEERAGTGQQKNGRLGGMKGEGASGTRPNDGHRIYRGTS